MAVTVTDDDEVAGAAEIEQAGAVATRVTAPTLGVAGGADVATDGAPAVRTATLLVDATGAEVATAGAPAATVTVVVTADDGGLSATVGAAADSVMAAGAAKLVSHEMGRIQPNMRWLLDREIIIFG